LSKERTVFPIRIEPCVYNPPDTRNTLELRDVNRILEGARLTMHSVHLASMDGQTRLTFSVDCVREQRSDLSLRLHESNVFATVAIVGTTEQE